MIAEWWKQAEAHKVLPLDDRFGPRFAENAARTHHRRQFIFHKGVGHIPTEVAPDVRGRSYLIEADVTMKPGDHGVLIAHGDATSGYSLYLQDGYLVHDLNIGGEHQIVRSGQPVPPGDHVLGLHMLQEGKRVATLLIDGKPCGSAPCTYGFFTLVSWSGLDIGLDRGSPVSTYEAPFTFTGELRKVDDHHEPRPGARRRRRRQQRDGAAVGQRAALLRCSLRRHAQPCGRASTSLS